MIQGESKILQYFDNVRHNSAVPVSFAVIVRVRSLYLKFYMIVDRIFNVAGFYEYTHTFVYYRSIEISPRSQFFL